MAFDEEAADRVVAELAATTDEEMVADISAAVEQLGRAWGAWRGSREYPLARQPGRPAADARGATVIAAVNGVRALTSRADLAGAITAARAPLDQAWPHRRPGERLVVEAVERLHYLAIVKPGFVNDARMIAAELRGQADR